MTGSKSTEEQREAGKKRREQKIKDWDAAHPDHDLFCNVPRRYQSKWIDAMNGDLSSKQAAKMKCLDCVCYQKEEVTFCPMKNRCPLWTDRPYQNGICEDCGGCGKSGLYTVKNRPDPCDTCGGSGASKKAKTSTDKRQNDDGIA
jgi:hypothetical protein